MDPGPQTQLRTQNAKRVFHRRGPPRGPPRTQLRRNCQGTKSFSFCVWGPLSGPMFWFCVWGPLSGPENSVDPTQKIRRTCGVRTCGPAYKYRRTCGPAHKYRRTCGPTSINFYLSARISVLSYCMSDCCTAFFQVLNFYLTENCTFFTAKSYQTEL